MNGKENKGIKLPRIIGPNKGAVTNGTPYPKPSKSIGQAVDDAFKRVHVPTMDDIVLPPPSSF